MKKLQKQPAQGVSQAQSKPTSKAQGLKKDRGLVCSSLEAIASGVSIKEAVRNVKHPTSAKVSSILKADSQASSNNLTRQKTKNDLNYQLSSIVDKNSLEQLKLSSTYKAPTPSSQSTLQDSSQKYEVSDRAYDRGADKISDKESARVSNQDQNAVLKTANVDGCGLATKKTTDKVTHSGIAKVISQDSDGELHDACSEHSFPEDHNDPRYLEQRKHGTRIFPIDCHHWKTSNGPGYNIWHWHPEIEIMHLIEGKAFEIEFADRHFIVDAPAIMIVPSRVLHRGNNDRTFDVYGVEGKANYTMFDPSILEMARFDEALNNTLGVLESPLLNLSTPILGTDEGFAELERILKFVEDFAKDKDAGVRLQVKGYLLQFLGVLHHYGYLNNHHIARPRARINNQNEERIKEIFDYINNNYNRPISIIDVASRLGISKQYFCRLFKSLTNMSFVEYLNVVRLNNAAQDIVLSNTSINEIAEKHGFDSISYFFKVFKLQFNCTPNTFRQRKGMVTELSQPVKPKS